MTLKADVCTTQNLIDALRNNVRILHISCHGYYNEEKNPLMRRRKPMGMLVAPDDAGLESSLLLLETENGSAEFVSAK